MGDITPRIMPRIRAKYISLPYTAVALTVLSRTQQAKARRVIIMVDIPKRRRRRIMAMVLPTTWMTTLAALKTL